MFLYEIGQVELFFLHKSSKKFVAYIRYKDKLTFLESTYKIAFAEPSKPDCKKNHSKLSKICFLYRGWVISVQYIEELSSITVFGIAPERSL